MKNILAVVFVLLVVIGVRAADLRDFAMFADTQDSRVNAGETLVYDIAAYELDGGPLEDIKLTCTGAPKGATCRVEPAVITRNDFEDPVVVIQTSARMPPAGWRGLMYADYRPSQYTATPPGTYYLTLTGTNPEGVHHEVKLPITVYW